MSGEVTVPRFPLDARVGITGAETTGGKFHDSLTSFALFHDGMARSPIVPAACFGHEGAFGSRLHRLTNHDDHLPFLSGFSSENRGNTTHENEDVKRLGTFFVR